MLSIILHLLPMTKDTQDLQRLSIASSRKSPTQNLVLQMVSRLLRLAKVLVHCFMNWLLVRRSDFRISSSRSLKRRTSKSTSLRIALKLPRRNGKHGSSNKKGRRKPSIPRTILAFKATIKRRLPANPDGSTFHSPAWLWQGC